MIIKHSFFINKNKGKSNQQNVRQDEVVRTRTSFQSTGIAALFLGNLLLCAMIFDEIMQFELTMI